MYYYGRRFDNSKTTVRKVPEAGKNGCKFNCVKGIQRRFGLLRKTLKVELGTDPRDYETVLIFQNNSTQCLNSDIYNWRISNI